MVYERGLKSPAVTLLSRDLYILKGHTKISQCNISLFAQIKLVTIRALFILLPI